MNVTSRRFANAVVVRAAGRLDQDTCEAFRTDLLKYVDEAVSDGGGIVLDLSGLEYVSSAGLRCFIIASRQVKAKQGRILVAQMQPIVAEIFAISHFNLLFEVFPTVKAALDAVSREAASAFERG